ncbi:MAG: polyhydroxyalkanoate synthesis regulator DNA-binding domain-containing protein [Deltaproteobacteria bacterium]|nr:polyhydroxyalkanoate synthesis regulator DNA-binding domain-containing protein [Deltaproteobacteria bacterium]
MNQSNAVRLIKRYGNRKLYDTLESRYITLEEIARLVRAGSDVKVIDNENGGDLTTITFAQIILEEEKRRSSLLSLGLLRELIQHGEDTLATLRSRVDKGLEAIGSMGELAGRRVQEMVSGRGSERGASGTHADATAPPAEQIAEVDVPGRGFFDDLLSAPQRRLESLQRSIDERIKSSVGRITGHPAFQNEVRRIERSIKKLEERLARLRRREDVGPTSGDDVR